MTGSAGGLPESDVKPIDVLAIKSGRTPVVIQVSKRRGDISPEEISELLYLASTYGADPIYVFKSGKRREFFFEDACTGKLLDPTKFFGPPTFVPRVAHRSGQFTTKPPSRR